VLTVLCVAHIHALSSQEHGDGFGAIQLSIGNFIRGDYSAATVLISFGAVLGRVSPLQMVLVLLWEVIMSTANEVIGVHKLGVSDPGGSMYIHTFGAAFGLALSWMLGDKAERGTPEQRATIQTSRHNGTFAMIGTLFLYIFWPSFNAVRAPSRLFGGDETQVTHLSCCAGYVCRSLAAQDRDQHDLIH
jgi:ammonium transporter Rh